MDKPHVLLAVFWILFCALHSGLASLTWKKKMQQLLGTRFRYYRLFYTVFAFVSLGLVLAYQLLIRSPNLYQPGVITNIPGVLILVSGLAVMAHCIRKYFMHLSGLKSLYLNDEAAANELQITGIHRYVRHPLYSGTFMAIWGLWLLIPQLSLLVANIIITVYTLLAISWEEQKLVAEFGDAYIRYKQQVPKLLPLPGKTMP